MCACGRGGRCGAEGRFLKKAPQKLLQRGTAVPAKTLLMPSIAFPHALCRELSKSFSGVFFSRAKRIPLVRENYGKKKARFLFPVVLSDWRRSQGFSSKNDAKYRCPPKKSFCGAFFKKRPPAPAGAHNDKFQFSKNQGQSQ